MTKKFLSMLFAVCILLSDLPAIGITAGAETITAPTSESGADFLKFTSDGPFSINVSAGNVIRHEGGLWYSADRSSWTDVPHNENIPAELENGKYVLYFAGKGNTVITGNSTDNRTVSKFNITASGTDMVSASGNIMTLLDYEYPDSAVMGEYAFYGMFNGCSCLETAPELPATTLSAHCYESMFANCTGLVSAPDLPAEVLADSCYSVMFTNCTSLTDPPVISAETLADSCCYNMFSDCKSLTSAPVLSAETLATKCYGAMFAGCTGLTELPELPATELSDECYAAMFARCTGLTELPELPATELSDKCYESMFFKCTGLKLTAEDEGYGSWSGIPEGASAGTGSLSLMLSKTGGDYTDDPEVGTTYYYMAPDYIKFTSDAEFSITPSGNWDGTLQYSVDNLNWHDVTKDTEIDSSDTDFVLYFKGMGNTVITGGNYPWTLTPSEGHNISVSGNIMALMDCENPDGNPVLDENSFYSDYELSEKYDYYSDYLDALGVLDEKSFKSSDLYKKYGSYSAYLKVMGSIKIGQSAFAYMFAGQTSLVSIPALTALKLSDNCYAHMFEGCTGIRIGKTDTSNGLWAGIPSLAEGGSGPFTDMFKGTSGSYTGEPEAGTRYYYGPRPVCKIEGGGQYASVAAALAENYTGESVNTPTTIILIGNDTENVEIPEGRYITLDLNGFVLSGGGSGSVIVNNGNLTVMDSNKGSVHYYTVDDNGVWNWDDSNRENAENYESLTDIPSEGDVIAVMGGALTGGTGTMVNIDPVNVGNNSGYCGGGIFNACLATLTDINIIGNHLDEEYEDSTDQGAYGAGVFNMKDSAMDIAGCNIAGNYTYIGGGGVYSCGGEACCAISESTVKCNSADSGGGIFSYGGGLTADGCSIAMNTTSYYGGGMYVSGGTFTVTGSRITGNISSNADGGGIYLYEGDFTARDSLIADNSAKNGGGIYISNCGNSLFDGCTVSGNKASGYGGGIKYECKGYKLILLDTIVTGNSAGSSGPGVYYYVNDTNCFAPGTLITMADGSKKAIEDISEGDSVKVFDHESGTVSNAPVYLAYKGENTGVPFILAFDNGISLSVVGCHDLLEKDSLKYVTLTEDNAGSYIGKYFYGEDGQWHRLVSVSAGGSACEYYSIYTAGCQNCFANGMLTVPDDQDYVLNIYELDESLKADEGQLRADIARYGLASYEYVYKYTGMDRDWYDSTGSKYCFIAAGKGLVTLKGLKALYDTTNDEPAQIQSPVLASVEAFEGMSPLMANVENTETKLSDFNDDDYKDFLVIGDGTKIYGNTDTNTSKTENLYLGSSSYIKIHGSLSDVNIGITLSGSTGRFTAYGNVTKTDVEYFFPDNASYIDRFNNADTSKDTSDDYLEICETYKVNVETCTNGSVSVDTDTDIAEGSTVTVTASPDDGYILDKVTISDSDGSDITDDVGYNALYGTFTMPDYDVTVSAEFINGHAHDGITFETELTDEFIESLAVDSSNNGKLLPSGTYYLSGDLNVYSSRSTYSRLYIRGDSTVRICLNGHTLTGTILAYDNTDLTVSSCKDGGKIYSDDSYYGCLCADSDKAVISGITLETNQHTAMTVSGNSFTMKNCTVKTTCTTEGYPVIRIEPEVSASFENTVISGKSGGIHIGSDGNTVLKDVTLQNNSEYDIYIYGSSSSSEKTVVTLDGATTADNIIFHGNAAVALGDDFAAGEIGVTIDSDVSVPYTICDSYSTCFRCRQLPYHISDNDGKAVLEYRIDEQPEKSNSYTFTLDMDGASTSKKLETADVTYQWYEVTENKLSDFSGENVIMASFTDLEDIKPETGKCYLAAGSVNLSDGSLASESYEGFFNITGFVFNTGSAPDHITFTSENDMAGLENMITGQVLSPVNGRYTMQVTEIGDGMSGCIVYTTTSAYEIKNVTFAYATPVTGETSNTLGSPESSKSYYCAATLTEDESEIISDTVTVPDAAVSDATCYAYLNLSKNIDIGLTIKNLGTDKKGTGFDTSKLAVTVDGTAVEAVTYDTEAKTVSCVLKAVEPKDIGADLHIAVIYDGVTVKEFNYSVMDYCKAVFALKAKDGTGQYDKLATLCEAILNYGKWAEDYYNETNSPVKVASTINEGHVINFTDYDFGEIEDVVVNGTAGWASLSIDSKITLKYYVSTDTDLTTGDDEETPNFYVVNEKGEKINSEYISVTGDNCQEGYNQVVSIELYAYQLPNRYTLRLKDVDTSKFCITYGVYNYCSDAQGYTADYGFTETLKTLCKAIHNYGQAAKAYIAE